MDLNSPQDAINTLSRHFQKLCNPYVGALFRFAFFHDGATSHFLTSHVIFREQRVIPRERVEYKQGERGRFIFVEHWCEGEWAALTLLSKLLSGEAEVEGDRLSRAVGNYASRAE